MAEKYTVEYNIHVNSSEAVAAINAFTKAAGELTSIGNQFRTLEGTIHSIAKSFSKIAGKKHTLRFSVKEANQNLQSVITKLERIDALASKNHAIMMQGASGSSGKSGNTLITGKQGNNSNIQQTTEGKSDKDNKNQNKQQPKKQAAPMRRRRAARAVQGGNLPYKVYGPSMVDSGGLGMVDMLKGMGVAYGISAIGSGIASIINDASEYDNLMQTTKNIIKSHDKDQETFGKRFATMEGIVRSVGVETKFTAPQVADASKFLAMAGFNLNDINNSIRPIADIALVGDTDLGETADLVTNIMTGYGIDSTGVRRAADIMTNTFTMSNTTLTEIAEAYKYAGSLLSAAGVSFEESTAGIGVLGNAGIKGSQAGTSMRTIMANIVNPTKKQKKVWDKYGIQRLDKNGNVRDLTAIFQDLHNADMPVSDIYQMFNRTAAQGAVALIKNVDIWNNIVKENFLSKGIAKELADQKKNTIQGLWAQLTSMFTEDGMQVFSSLEYDIKKILQETIDWLKTSEAAELFSSIGKTFMELVDGLKTFTQWMIRIYHWFGPFITSWMKLQMYLTAIIMPLRVVRSLFNFGTLAVQYIRQVGAMTTATRTFGASLQSAGVAGQRFKGGWLGGMFGKYVVTPYRHIKAFDLARKYPKSNAFRMVDAERTHVERMFAASNARRAALGIKPMTEAQQAAFLASRGYRSNWDMTLFNYYRENPKLKGKSAEVIERYARMNRQRFIGGMSQTGAGIGGIVGGFAGAALGSHLGEEGSGWSMFGSIGGAVAGTALGSLAMAKTGGWLATALPALLTNPYGWAAAIVAALGFAGYKIYDFIHTANEAAEANRQFIASTASVNGINYSEHASARDKYWQGIYNKQETVNQSLARHIQLVKEQMGIIDDVANKTNPKPYKETHKDEFETFSDAFSYRGSAQDAVLTPIYLPGTHTLDPYFKLESVEGRDDLVSYWGHKYNTNTVLDLERLGVAQRLVAMGRNTAEGTPLRKEIDSGTMQLLQAASLDEFNSIRNTNIKNATWRQYLTGTDNWNMDDFGRASEDQILRSYWYVLARNNTFREAFDLVNATTANAQMLKAYQNLLTLDSQGKEITQDLLKDFLLKSGIPVFDEAKYKAFGSSEWFKNFGYYDNQWHGYYTTRLDANGNPMYDKNGQELKDYHTVDEAKQAYIAFHQNILDMVNQVSPHMRAYFNQIANSPIWNVGGISPDGGLGTKIKIGGLSYTWSQEKNGYVSDLSGGAGKAISLAEAQRQGAVNADTTPTGSSTNSPGSKSSGVDSSQYKNHYNKSNAAPKQVIVRIGNLMNVESIDLSNPDNEAVITNLKNELAQALVDVVHDFDETWHG